MIDGSIVADNVTPVLRAEGVDDGLFRSLVPDVYWNTQAFVTLPGLPPIVFWQIKFTYEVEVEELLETHCGENQTCWIMPGSYKSLKSV